MLSSRSLLPSKIFLLASFLSSSSALAAFTPEENQGAIAEATSLFASFGERCLPVPNIPTSLSADDRKELRADLRFFLKCTDAAFSNIRLASSSRDAVADEIWAPASKSQKAALVELWDREASNARIRVESLQTDILQRYSNAISALDDDDKKARLAELESTMANLTSCASRFRDLQPRIAETERLVQAHNRAIRAGESIDSRRSALLQSKRSSTQAAMDVYYADCRVIDSSQPMANTLCSDSDNARFCSKYDLRVDPESDDFDRMMLKERAEVDEILAR